MDEPSPTPNLTFCVHLIGMYGRGKKLKVRMLVVATAGASAVYEGLGSWSTSVRWIRKLRCTELAGCNLATLRKAFERDLYVVVVGVAATLLDLGSMGLQRVDQ